MTNKIIQKVIAGIIVNLLILQTLPVVSAEGLVTPVSETPTTVSEPVITEPITDATVEPEPDQSIPGDEVAPTETEPDPAPAPAPEPEAPIEDIPQYNQLMRQVDKTVDFTFTENSFYKAILQNLPPEIKEEKYEASVENVTSELEIFIDSEKEKLADSDIDDSKKEQYFSQLEKQLDIIEGDIPPEAKPLEEVKIAPEPSSFTLDQKEIEVEQVDDLFVEKNVDPALMEDTLKKLKLIQVAEAYVDNYMPVLEDLQDDGTEVIINQEIRDLAAELEGNPVKIFNFVRNNIDYEPYYGAKKNSAGCLRERVCNDVDTASLTIALMRASGIPARYKKSLAIVDVRMLKELLGVEQTQTIFKAMQSPLFTVDGEHDFDAMTKLAVQWVHPEIFYPYDERSGNFSATAHPEFADINEMRAFLREFNDNQWIPVDAAMKSYTHTANEIVSDTEDFDTENFWQQYLEYQGESSPIQRYEEELGLNPENEQTRSGKTLIREEFDFLPYTLPYLVAQGNAEGNEIAIENFSTLPDNYKNHVTISLLNPEDDSTVLSHTFTASEVNNTPIELYYQGFTDLDETTIVEHGGVHATPAALVDIKPLLIVDGEQYEGDQPLQIGQSLLLQFEYPEFDKVDQKFSVAGNQEGIYMYFSKLQDDQFFDDESDPDRNSKILLEGNAMMAREYLRKVEDNTDTINSYLDYDYDVAVHRAVVTQKRILNELDEIATTFDFKGLSIDASLYGNGYSNRGPLETHSDDFSLLWLLYASYYESQLFTDLTGLNAISTVTGLQYAYGNPDQYDVVTVTSDNSNIIDDLDFSDNTKANMLSDIAEGATIITPDGPIQKENWRGIVYISRLPDGVDNYAIGEQAMGNGGEMTDEMEYIDSESEVEVKEKQPDGTIIIRKKGQTGTTAASPAPRGGVYTYNDEIEFTKDLKIAGQNCLINNEDLFNAWKTKNLAGWGDTWGAPCYKPGGFFNAADKPLGAGDPMTPEADTFYTSYGFLPILTRNGIKFFDLNYANDSYYVGFDVIHSGFEDYISEKKNLPPNNLNWLADGENQTNTTEGYKFSPTLGTVLWHICESKPSGVCGTYATVYYAPDDDNADYFRARTNVLDKLDENKKSVIKKLGIPRSDEISVESEEESGVYQNFTNGQIYNIDNAFGDDTYYVNGKIAKYYKDNGGAAGDFGFPTSDPTTSGSDIFQNFENEIVGVVDGEATKGTFVKKIEDEYVKNNDKDYWEGVIDQFTEEGIFGVIINVSSGVAIAKTVQRIMGFLASSKKFQSKLAKKTLVKFVPFVGWAFLSFSVIESGEELYELSDACGSDDDVDGASPKYYCGKRDALVVLVALGLVSQSKVIQNPVKNILKVGSDKARTVKNKIFSLLKDDTQKEDLVAVLKDNVLNRTKFFESIGHFDDANLKKILADKKYMLRLAEDDAFRAFTSHAKDVNRYKHIFLGDNSGGWHYYPTGFKAGSTEIIEILQTDPLTGIYKARVRINGVEKASASTFFPDSWSEKEVLESIDEAYRKIISDLDGTFIEGNTYEYIVDDIKIRFFLDDNSKVISTFPYLN